MTIDAASGASITLNADGSWSGDAEKFLAAVAVLDESAAHPGPVLIWLVANAIRKQSKTT